MSNQDNSPFQIDIDAAMERWRTGELSDSEILSAICTSICHLNEQYAEVVLFLRQREIEEAAELLPLINSNLQ